MTYQQAVRNLFKILKCNTTIGGVFQDHWVYLHDTLHWQVNSKVKAAIREIAGQEILDHWVMTGKVDMKLASRNKFGK